jgi:hypothetical protein
MFPVKCPDAKVDATLKAWSDLVSSMSAGYTGMQSVVGVTIEGVHPENGMDMLVFIQPHTISVQDGKFVGIAHVFSKATSSTPPTTPGILEGMCVNCGVDKKTNNCAHCGMGLCRACYGGHVHVSNDRSNGDTPYCATLSAHPSTYTICCKCSSSLHPHEWMCGVCHNTYCAACVSNHVHGEVTVSFQATIEKR